jgi:hypothetical protein
MKKLIAAASLLLLGACSGSDDCASPEARDKVIESVKAQPLPNVEGVADKYELQDIRTEKVDKERKTAFCAATLELSKLGARGVAFTKPVTWKVPVTYTVIESSAGTLHVQVKTGR